MLQLKFNGSKGEPAQRRKISTQSFDVLVSAKSFVTIGFQIQQKFQTCQLVRENAEKPVLFPKTASQGWLKHFQVWPIISGQLFCHSLKHNGIINKIVIFVINFININMITIIIIISIIIICTFSVIRAISRFQSPKKEDQVARIVGRGEGGEPIWAILMGDRP